MKIFLQYSQGELIISTSGQQMYEVTKDLNAWLNKAIDLPFLNHN